MRQFLAAAAGAALALGIAGAAAQQKPIELRYTSGAPPKTPWEKQINRFVEDIDRESKGQLKIVPYINAQLGNEQDTIQQVARGRIDVGGFSITAAALLVPELSLMSVPFVWKDQAEFDCVQDKHLFDFSAQLLERRGAILLGWTEVGTVDIVGKKPLLKPDDVKGMKVRIQPSKTSAVFWKALGANGTPLGITEINSGLQTGLVEAADLPITFYFPAGVGKLAPHVTMTQHILSGGVSIISKQVWSKLDPQHQGVISKVALSSPAELLRKEVRGMEAFLRQQHEKAGGTIHKISDAERDAWKRTVEPHWPEMVKAVGGQGEKFWKLIQDGKKACTAKAS
jgi:TRAP-type C4-dicarboxylate transport system substrate-binding protein